MAVPSELLRAMGELEGSLADVRNSVDRVLADSRDAGAQLLVRDGIAAVEESVETWLRRTEGIEERLLAHRLEVPSDAYDVQARIGGLSMMHMAVAADVAGLRPLDDLPQEAPLAAVQPQLPERAVTIQEAAFGEGQLLNAISHAPDDAEEEPEEGGGQPDGFEGSTADSGGDAIDEVVGDIVEEAAKSGTAVLFSLARGSVALFGPVTRDLAQAVELAPDGIRDAIVSTVGAVARLVKKLLARATRLLNAVLEKYSDVVRDVVEEGDPAEAIAVPLGRRLVGRLVRPDYVRAEAKRRMPSGLGRRARLRRIRKLTRTHSRWVGPVRVVAKGLPALWAIPVVGHVAAAPIAAVALLGWTLLITGDQLDAPGMFPNLWKGVIRRADGE